MKHKTELQIEESASAVVCEETPVFLEQKKVH